MTMILPILLIARGLAKVEPIFSGCSGKSLRSQSHRTVSPIVNGQFFALLLRQVRKKSSDYSIRRKSQQNILADTL